MKTRIWNLTNTFPGKVNFIDTNNVILGYDLSQCCCEHAFWTVSESKDGTNPLLSGDDLEGEERELDGYVFDPEFFERMDNDGEEKYVAVFRLIVPRSDRPDLYIRLENHHNGYYSHGFIFRGKTSIESAL